MLIIVTVDGMVWYGMVWYRFNLDTTLLYIYKLLDERERLSKNVKLRK